MMNSRAYVTWLVKIMFLVLKCTWLLLMVTKYNPEGLGSHWRNIPPNNSERLTQQFSVFGLDRVARLQGKRWSYQVQICQTPVTLHGCGRRWLYVWPNWVNARSEHTVWVCLSIFKPIQASSFWFFHSYFSLEGNSHLRCTDRSNKIWNCTTPEIASE